MKGSEIEAVSNIGLSTSTF